MPDEQQVNTHDDGAAERGPQAASVPIWQFVQAVLLSEYGEHQECDGHCTHAGVEEAQAHEAATRILVGLLARGWDGPG